MDTRTVRQTSKAMIQFIRVRKNVSIKRQLYHRNIHDAAKVDFAATDFITMEITRICFHEYLDELLNSLIRNIRKIQQRIFAVMQIGSVRVILMAPLAVLFRTTNVTGQNKKIFPSHGSLL
jgi:tRNA-binding EMAP/Myf-like protein